ncbi:MAG: TonB-dependent receptor [Acidobacteria bacterium]|nr:TonB-dependent receptor [Acidobacteriota bacterium]
MKGLRPSRFLISVIIFSLCLALSVPAWAQKDAGSIVGTVKDGSGAVVVAAEVEVTDIERGQTFKTTTGESGEYVASPLHVGRYKVTVAKSGFKKAVSETVELNIQGRVAVNVTLQLGLLTEEVIVTGAAPLLETETSELGQVVDQKRVSNLPLNGRNFAQLALLSTGTAPSEPGARDEGGYGFSANGARSLQNNFLLDGVDNNSNLPDLLNETNFVIQPPVEALQEFKVQTNAYSAEFGRGNGAIVNAVIKSGTNQIHGSAWQFLRNNKLDGRNYFDDPTKSAPQYQQNQFGVTFGGPIYLGHLYDGRSRSFFFVDYEGLRVRQAQTQTAFVPPAGWRTGDFSDLIDYTSVTGTDCNGRPTYAGEIFDARLAQVGIEGQADCGVPFQYDESGTALNIIPATPVVAGGGSLDPLALRLAALYPAAGPIQSSGNNYLANPVRAETRNNFDARVDQKFSDKDNAFFRFSFEHQPSSIPGTFGGLADGGGFFSGNEDFSYRSIATSWTHVFKPELINEFRLGYNRVNAQRLQLNADVNVSADPSIDFPGVPFSAGIGGLPQLGFSDVATLGSPTFLPSKELQNSYTLSENMTWLRGRHTWKYGTEIRREEFTIFQPAAARGFLGFDNTLTDNPAAIGNGGSGFASFMAGLTNGGGINNLHNVDYFRNTYAFYAQDDWKVTPNLVLNIGLRYELFGTVSERFDDTGNFDLSNPTDPTIILPKGKDAQLTPFISGFVKVSPTGSRGLINSDLNNFAPRFGLAWQFAPKTVLRAGFGVFYGGQENGPYSNPSPGFNPPFFVNQSFVAPCSAPSANETLDCRVAGIPSLASGFPSSALTDPNTPVFFSVDKNLRTPYMQQWHLGFEKELPGNSVLAVTYGGSKGTKLYTFFNGNQASPTTDSNAPTAPRRLVKSTGCTLDTPDNCSPVFDTGIDWFRSTGSSNYNSLQARFEKRFSKGLQFEASYTWAHSIDIASNANLGPTQNNSDFRDYRNASAERGNSDFDVRHRFVLNSIYELPFGHGRRFLGQASGIANQVAGGWQVANILSISTGNWYTMLDGNGNFANADGGAGGVSQRPDRVGDPNKAGPVAANPDCVAPDRIRTPAAWFNTCAFIDPGLGSFGSVGRNTIQAPGYTTWDMSVFKNFHMTERTNLEFRAEFFNVLNHTNFLFANSGPQNGNNATILGTSQQGALTAARTPRQIQFALKVSF